MNFTTPLPLCLQGGMWDQIVSYSIRTKGFLKGARMPPTKLFSILSKHLCVSREGKTTMTQHNRSISFQPEQDKNMPAWERKMREAGLTPFWDHVDDPLTELLTRASRVRITGTEEESPFSNDEE